MSCGNCKCDCSCTPEKGDQGLPGIQGEQGIQGVQGIQGEQGEQGDQGIQGVPGDDADALFGSWISLPLDNSWVPSATAPEYCKNNSELALLRGSVSRDFTSNGFDSLIATLPVGYRPTTTIRIPVHFQRAAGGQVGAFTTNRFMTLELNTLGELSLMQYNGIIGGLGYYTILVDLSAIMYRAEQ